MSGGGLEIGPIALLIGVLGYVLKRWWDNADEITRSRKVHYQSYFESLYGLVRTASHFKSEEHAKKVAEAYEKFQISSPAFLFYGSPRALLISDEVVRRFRKLEEALEGPLRDESELSACAWELNESLGVLRELMKSEIFFSQPTFVIERFRHKQKVKKFLEESK